MSILRDLWLWFWRLLPANPILVRVVSAGGKRVRHLYARLAYLVVLFVVMLLARNTLSGQGAMSLSDLAKQSTQTFQLVSIVQLLLMSFIAPVFTAGAITQEKDSNTFHILLTTPLSAGQIVLGSLMSRLYFVWVLLLSGLPIFCITMIFGGVTTAEVFQSFALAACTGLVTGSIAISISMMKVGTRRTILAFFVGIATYLLALLALGLTAWGQLPADVAPEGTPIFAGTTSYRMSWLAPIHPFLALFVVTGNTPAPPMSNVVQYGWPWSWLLAYPQYGYMVVTVLVSIVMILLSLSFVRKGEKEGEETWWTRISGVFRRKAAVSERMRKPRRVWNNPVAWREAATKASAGGRSALRWVFVVLGGIAGIMLLAAVENQWWGLSPTVGRTWLVALILIELASILLVITNTAATALTREKESLTMELLLSTPLTSYYIVAGMLRGLVSFALPLIAVPTGTVLLFVLADTMRHGAAPVTTPETVLLLPLQLIAFTSLAAMVGLHFSLVSRKTVQAVMISTTVVLGAAGLLWACGWAMGQGNAMVAAVVLPFSPFPSMSALVNPARLADLGGATVGEIRATRTVTTLISVALYAAITFSIYKNMVRGFDMTVRRQAV